jgi:hypothetical protein
MRQKKNAIGQEFRYYIGYFENLSNYKKYASCYLYDNRL